MVHMGRLRRALVLTALLNLSVAGCTSADGSTGPESAATSTSTMVGGTTGGAVSAGDAATSTGGAGFTTAGMTTGTMTIGSMTGGMTTGGVDAAAGGSGTTASVGTGAEGNTSSGGASGSTGTGGTGGTGGMGGTFEGKELFILIGQSNMSGMSPMPSEPWPINERVTFMVQFDCERLGQTAGEWLPAEPPLHGCHWATGGIGLGLADFFGAKLAEEWPDANIGLIPNAIPGQLISIYLKEGGTQAPIPPGYANAYEMTVERSRKAQEQGRIRAILMHQGESDDNQMMSDQWLGRVATVIADLRADLNLGEEVPFLAGQIGPSQWQKHNAYVDQIPDYVPNSAVISAEGTAIHDIAHFDEASAKIMGERYAEKFLEMVSPR